jgi:LPXTG-motif cell wall-anchored protein
VLAVPVNSTTQAQVVVLELRRPGGAPTLPWTGTQVTVIGAAALSLLAAGILFFIAGRRRRRADEEDSA